MILNVIIAAVLYGLGVFSLYGAIVYIYIECVLLALLTARDYVVKVKKAYKEEVDDEKLDEDVRKSLEDRGEK